MVKLNAWIRSATSHRLSVPLFHAGQTSFRTESNSPSESAQSLHAGSRFTGMLAYEELLASDRQIVRIRRRIPIPVKIDTIDTH